MLIKSSLAAPVNGILSALPPKELQAISPALEPVKLPLGTVLTESGDLQNHVWFPLNAVVSLLYVLEDGS